MIGSWYGLMKIFRLSVCVSFATLLASASLAAEPAPLATATSANDAPMAQPPAPVAALAQAAPATASPDATSAQIKGWISADSHDLVPADDSPYGPQPRATHGEVGVSVGSRGYSSVYGVADIPVGQNSDLVVAASNSNGAGGRRGYGGYGGTSNSLAIGFYANGAANSAPACNGSHFGAPPAWAGQPAPICPPQYAPDSP
jgi:hypothetical protein